MQEENKIINQEEATSEEVKLFKEKLEAFGSNALFIVPFMGETYYKMFSSLQKETGISQGEIDVLAFLYNHPQYHCACDLVQIRGISRSHASEAVNKLVKKGFLRRDTDENNRRKHILTITDKAYPLCARIRKLQIDYQNKLHAGISEEDLAVFTKVLVQQYVNLGGKASENSEEEN